MIRENNNDVDSSKVPFEVALDRAGFGLYSYQLTGFAGLCIVSLVCVVYSTTIIAPTSSCELGTSPAEQGYIVAAPILECWESWGCRPASGLPRGYLLFESHVLVFGDAGLIFGGIIWGRLADVKGRRKTLLLSLFLATTLNAVSSISVNWIMLMIIQFLAAVCASGMYPIALTLLSESVPMERRNVLILIVSSIFLLSQGIQSLLAIPIISLRFSYYISGLDIYWNPWRTLIVVYCAPCIICIIWLYFLQESPKFVFNSKGDEQAALKILRVIHKMNNRNATEEFQVKGLQVEKDTSSGQNASIFKPPLLKYLIIMTTLMIFLKTSAFMAWLPTILNQFVEIFKTGEGRDYSLCEMIRSSQVSSVENDLPPCALDETSLLLIFGVGAIQSIFNICVLVLINKAGRRNMAIGISAVCGVSGILVNLVPNAIASALLFMVFLLGMVLVGLYSAISIALFPTSQRAVALAITSTGGRIVLVIIIQVLNWLLLNNCELGFYIFASIVASSAVILSFLPDDRRLAILNSPKTMEENKDM